MNRKLHAFLVILCCLIAFGCSTPENNKVSVRGDIKHLDSSPLFISYFSEEGILAYDTVFSSNSGKFEFNIHTYNEISPITIFFSKKKCWTTLFAQPGDNIRIKGDIHLVDMLNISGGVVNDELSQFKKQICKIYEERLAILQGKYHSAEESEERLAEINLQLKRSAKVYIKEHPSSISSVVLIQDFFYQDYDPSTKELLDILDSDARNSHLATRIREGIEGW